MATIERTIIASIATVPIDIAGTTATNAETLNGAIPGPLILAMKDDTLIVRLINRLGHPTGIHWHGIELQNYSDGTPVTQNGVPGGNLQIINGVPSGATFLYKFKVPRAGIYWYHPHHHHSTNRVFRGQYGMIVVSDPDEQTLVTPTIPVPVPILPIAANTHQFVLSDITVCKAAGSNNAETYEEYMALPLTEQPEWMNGTVTVQTGDSPDELCELPTALDDHGDLALVNYLAGEIPGNHNVIAGRTVEGQTVLTNGRNVGYRRGTPTPSGPGALELGYTSISAQPGQGIRLQFVNSSTLRYFRLRLTDSTGALINLIRVGGEGGVLNDAIIEGGVDLGGFDSKYFEGEILIPTASRADVVAVIPLGTNNTTCTIWTRDFQRVGPANPGGWAQLPTVPVLHIDIGNVPVPLFPMVAGTQLKSSPTLPPTALTQPLGPATNNLLDPGLFPTAKLGSFNQIIQLTNAMGILGIDGTSGDPLHDHSPYTDTPHIVTSRYGTSGDILELTIENTTNANHPFHLHGFSFQPISFTSTVGPLIVYTWPFTEFRDNLNIPAKNKLLIRVLISDRELVDGVTMGGALGRWLFHCHIFFHAHHGMLSELVITAANGNEKPNVNVGGSWVYAPKPGTAFRKGTFYDRDLNTVTLTATRNDGGNPGVLTYPLGTSFGNWDWLFDTEAAPATPVGIYYVYITATDSTGLKDQCVFRLRVGLPDDGSDNGDPHIHTVDGKSYDFQAAGEFTLLMDEEFEVQARQTPVLTANPITDGYTGLKSCASLNTAVAARVGTHRIAYQPCREPGQFQFFVDGKPAKLTTEGLNLDGHHVSGFDVNGKMALRVDYLHHAVLIATPLFWTSHNVWYLNISISRTQADAGIMGAIPQNTWLPLLQNGASVGPMPTSLNERYITLYKNFADSWRLTDKSSLFVYERGTSTSTFTDKDWPAGEPPCKLLPQFEIPGWVIPEGMDIEKAGQICEIVTDDGLNKDCVFDVATTGDADFAKAYLITQEIRQRSTAVQIVATGKKEITAIVSPLINGGPTPKGTVTFYVENSVSGQPIELDTAGRAIWKTVGLDEGTYDVRAIYTPIDGAESYYPSSSPNLRLLVPKGTGEHNGGINKGCLAQPWYVWVVLILILLLLVLLVWKLL
ncbi:MAG: multicopper oxidase domain-containing protein [Acidobacteriota bacterium]